MHFVRKLHIFTTFARKYYYIQNKKLSTFKKKIFTQFVTKQIFLLPLFQIFKLKMSNFDFLGKISQNCTLCVVTGFILAKNWAQLAVLLLHITVDCAQRMYVQTDTFSISIIIYKGGYHKFYNIIIIWLQKILLGSL